MTTGKKTFSALFLTVTGVMAALACISNLIRIPLGESMISVSNAVCVLCGLILGPASGFLAAGIGNFLYDIFVGYGYESLITFISKGAIALVVAFLSGELRKKEKLQPGDSPRLFLACALGALTYVVLYMLKTFIFGLTVNGLTMEATWIRMGAKLPASLINAVFAAIAAPVFYAAVRPALKHTDILRRL